MELSLDINNAYSLVSQKLEEWVNQGIQMLPNVVVAIIILLVSVLRGKLLRRLFSRVLRSVTDNNSLRALLGNVFYVAIGTFIALSVLNLGGTVSSLLAGAGVIGLAWVLPFRI